MQLLCVGEVLRETWGEVCTEDALILVREERESLLVSFPFFFQRKTDGWGEAGCDKPGDETWPHCPEGWDAQGCVSYPPTQQCWYPMGELALGMGAS